MTRTDEQNIERMLGRIEAQLEMQAGIINKLVEKAEKADEWRHEVKERLERNEEHSLGMTKVAKAFDELQRSIREGSLAAKAYSRGVLLGIGIAAGGAGATIATGIKWAWSALTGGTA